MLIQYAIYNIVLLSAYL